jgi:hypothetical protein
MVRHWRRLARRGGDEARGWRRALLINGAGAVITGFVVMIIVVTRFTQGVWVVIAAMPFLVMGFVGIRRHYDSVARQLDQGAEQILRAPSVHGRSPADVAEHAPARARRLAAAGNTVVLLVDSVNAATATALGYVRSFAGADFHAVHLPGGHDERDLLSTWRAFSRSDRPLEILSGRTGADAVIDYVRRLPRADGSFLTVVIPELFTTASLMTAVRRRTAIALKVRLLSEPQVVITDVPVLARPSSATEGPSVVPRPLIPRRAEALILVSGASDATVRAVNYAMTLNAHDTRAIFVALDAASATRIQEAWGARRIPIQLDIVEAPFRDMAPPILEEVRRVTAHPDSLATVIIPELVMRSWWHHALHNQRALFLKRLLLFEPNVVLSSVPFQIR